jgi:UV DNA damage endonuclease
MYKPRIGFVSNVIVGEEKLYYRSAKLASIEKHGLDKIIDVYGSNISTAEQIIRYCSNNGISYYRMGTLFPFSGHEAIGNFDYIKHFDDQLYELGQLIKVKDIRISFHASEFCVLNSKNPKVVKNSIVELENTVKIIEKLELPEHNKIIVHTGSAEGGIPDSLKRFSDVFSKLDESIKKRVTLENDDRIFSFAKVYEIYKMVGIPLTIDIFHHRVLNPEKLDEIDSLKRAIETWNGLVPEVHYSCQSLVKDKKGAHSQSIDVESLLDLFDKTKGMTYDVMMEVKDTSASAENIISQMSSYYKN